MLNGGMSIIADTLKMVAKVATSRSCRSTSFMRARMV